MHNIEMSSRHLGATELLARCIKPYRKSIKWQIIVKSWLGLSPIHRGSFCGFCRSIPIVDSSCKSIYAFPDSVVNCRFSNLGLNSQFFWRVVLLYCLKWSGKRPLWGRWKGETRDMGGSPYLWKVG
jgi:hypothetical protein